MKFLTRGEVVRTLGPVDDVVVAEIVGTGASAQELSEAQAWLANDEALVNDGRRLPAGRVGQLIEILRRIEDEEPGPAGHPM